MADRASYLARVLLTRLHYVEMSLLEESGGREAEGPQARRDMVAKVLACEVGLTDEQSISRVVEFLPRVVAGMPIPMHDYIELADLLRNNLRLD